MPRKSQVHGHDTRYLKMQKNYCFACGQNNPAGMRLKFTLDEERQTFVCEFRLSKRYTGPPGHCHGGIIATILDDAMGKVNKLHVEGKEVSVHGRQHINVAEILNEKNEALARSKGIFIAIDPEKMFAKFVER
jgi:acyl-coenzyme A thioesterase PaaI-like protein